MPRTLTALFRRDPSKDRPGGTTAFEGYRILWPDGRPVAVGLDAFCTQGQRLLGLGRHLGGRPERLIRLTCFPLGGPDDGLNRLPGHRVRRLFIERRGNVGRLHFMDGTPTALVFDLGKDEPEVLHWVGLSGLNEGERLWFDLMAAPLLSPDRPADAAAVRVEQVPTTAERVVDASPRGLPFDESRGSPDRGSTHVSVNGGCAVRSAERAADVQAPAGTTAAAEPQSPHRPDTAACPPEVAS
jgi:hypothetical protein